MKIQYLEQIRRYWNAHSQEYCDEHPEHLNPALHPSWGLSHIPERELRLLPGPDRGDQLVDLGCGRGHDAIGFAKLGYQVTGVDIAEAQIARAFAHERVRYLVGNAERLPLEPASVDVMVSDHGAFDHSLPERLLAEAYRLLKPGCMLVICTYSPIALSCFDPGTGRIVQQLTGPYPVDDICCDGRSVMPFLGFSAWVRKLQTAGFTVVRVEEPLFSPERRMYFDELVDPAWAARWPVDLIMVAHRNHDRQNEVDDDAH